MNHITSSLKNLAGLLAAAVLIAFSLTSITSARADSPAQTAAAPALSATEAIFYTQGALDAQSEAPDITASVTAQTTSQGAPSRALFPFRVLAQFNRMSANCFVDMPLLFAYFQGRADAFDSLADLFGEP